MNERRLKTFHGLLWMLLCVCLPAAGCSAKYHRQRADQTAYTIIDQKQQAALGRTEPFTIESPAETLRRRLLLDQNLPHGGPASLGTRDLEPIAHWPESDDPVSQTSAATPLAADEPGTITLLDALQIASQNSRDYQTAKEEVFRSALNLDLERDQFRSTFAGLLEGAYTQDRTALSDPLGEVTEGWEGSAVASVARRFRNGAELTARLGWDIAHLLDPERFGSRSVFGDASITIPLLRGAGSHIAAEPLTQAERDVIYSIYDFERFKRGFAVRVASAYLSVLRSRDSVRNSEENYRGLIASSRRARRLGDAGQLSPVQVDQAIQDELSARDRWIRSRESYAADLDSFKILLGLPTDATIELDPDEMTRLAATVRDVMDNARGVAQDTVIPPGDAPIILTPPDRDAGGPLELPEREAIELALGHRLDMRIAESEVEDAQRRVVVAADALRAELTLLGRVSVGEGRGFGSASADDADSLGDLSFNEGLYTGLLTLDLPFERTAEAIAYRNSWINLERSVRAVQGLEDQIKLDVRNRLRELLQSRESLQTQALAVALAERRVRSTQLYLEAGRVQIRDLLEAQDDLLSAQNALTAAMVDYRIAELELQRDMDLLEVDEQGMWKEYQPEERQDETRI